MKAMLYLNRMDTPVSVLDNVKVVQFDTDNHSEHSNYRIFFSSEALSAGKTMVDLHRDQRLLVKLEDGRTANALLLHSSLDMEGNSVGVLRVLGDFQV